MRRTLQGTRLIVTGASSGIGRSVASACVRAGARVALAARSLDRLEQLARQLAPEADRAGGAVRVVPTDITRADQRQRLLHTVAEQFGGLDVLVNNAGVASFGHFATGTEEVLRQVMEVNFFAPAELIRAAVPLLREGHRPAVVNVASMCGRRGMPAWSEYSASKFALVGLTEALRGEMARFDIDVLLIVPGLTASELAGHLLRDEGRMKIGHAAGMPPQRVADGILRSLQAGRREAVLGWEARWILRVNRFLPRLVDALVARRVRKLYSR
jgi:short-subunit dehydrogenase